MLRSDTLIPLMSGAYQSRTSIANWQICENLFPEINPQNTDSPVPMTHIPREGKRSLSKPPVLGVGRGVFTTSNGHLYAVAGSTLYAINNDWVWSVVGNVSNLRTPVSMSDNGATAVLVDGSPNGWQITLSNNDFSPIVDDTGTFVGSIRTDFADTFLMFAAPGTNRWYVSDSNQISFNALAQANKDSYPDNIATLIFNLRQAWLLGEMTSEIWYLSGITPFPYQSWPNVQVPHGCVAPYSLVKADTEIFFLSRNKEGQTIALKSKGNGVVAISTRGLEYEWSNYLTVADCIGATFQQAGHTFVIFNFPTADVTWAYDLATEQWHRRTYLDQNGIVHREKTAFYATVGAFGGYRPTIVGQDWATGEIYALDPKCYTDNGLPIVFRRTFPHVMKDMKEITHVSFVADFETGGIEGYSEPGAPPGDDTPWSSGFSNGYGPNLSRAVPSLCMRYSNDGGNNWSNYRQKYLVSSGHYRSMMRWRGLGMARDRVYELLWAYPGPSALQGAYLDPIEHSA